MMMYRETGTWVKRLCAACGIFVLSACKTVDTKAPVSPPVKPTLKPAAAPKTPRNSRQKIVHELLRSGQIAFKKDQLSTPSHENAYDLFKSVLSLDPGNPQAKSGMQAIVIRYASFVRKALAEQNFSRAQAYLEVARELFSDNALLKELAATLAQDRAHAKRVAQQSLAPASYDEQQRPDFYPLDAPALRARSKVIQQFIKDIGLRVSKTGESVLIYAKTDAQGRWIYQQLNKASKDYRVRGDIRISSTPKIVLLPSLD